MPLLQERQALRAEIAEMQARLSRVNQQLVTVTEDSAKQLEGERQRRQAAAEQAPSTVRALLCAGLT